MSAWYVDEAMFIWRPDWCLHFILLHANIHDSAFVDVLLFLRNQVAPFHNFLSKWHAITGRRRQLLAVENDKN